MRMFTKISIIEGSRYKVIRYSVDGNNWGRPREWSTGHAQERGGGRSVDKATQWSRGTQGIHERVGECRDLVGCVLMATRSVVREMQKGSRRG